jgi:hypothetical protein
MRAAHCNGGFFPVAARRLQIDCRAFASLVHTAERIHRVRMPRSGSLLEQSAGASEVTVNSATLLIEHAESVDCEDIAFSDRLLKFFAATLQIDRHASTICINITQLVSGTNMSEIGRAW